MPRRDGRGQGQGRRWPCDGAAPAMVLAVGSGAVAPIALCEDRITTDDSVAQTRLLAIREKSLKVGERCAKETKRKGGRGSSLLSMHPHPESPVMRCPSLRTRNLVPLTITLEGNASAMLAACIMRVCAAPM